MVAKSCVYVNSFCEGSYRSMVGVIADYSDSLNK